MSNIIYVDALHECCGYDGDSADSIFIDIRDKEGFIKAIPTIKLFIEEKGFDVEIHLRKRLVSIFGIDPVEDFKDIFQITDKKNSVEVSYGRNWGVISLS